MPSEETEGFRDRVKRHVQGLCSVVRAHPSTLLWPVLLFCLLCGMGVWAVWLGAKASSESAQAKARSLAHNAGDDYRESLSTAFSMTEVLASLVELDPNYNSVSRLFNAIAPALVNASSSSVQTLELVPSGVVRLFYPREGNDALLGLDLFAVPIPFFFDSLRNAIVNGGMSLDGPFDLGRSQSPTWLTVSSSEGVVLVVRRPIFVPAANERETFGRPDLPNPVCGLPCSYNSTTGMTFWGMAAVLVKLGAEHNSMSSPLHTLAVMGYRYLLVGPAGAGASNGEVNPATTVVASSAVPPGPGSVETAIQISQDIQWTLIVGPNVGSWMPKWYGGGVAMVVVLSLAASLLLMWLLVSRRRQRMLLHSLLPSELLRVLQGEAAVDLANLQPRDHLSDTPSNLLIALLSGLLSGLSPDLRDVVLLRTVLLRHVDIHRPLNLGGKLQNANLDSDVARSLMRQLGAQFDQATRPAGPRAAAPAAQRPRGNIADGECNSDGCNKGVVPPFVRPLSTTSSTAGRPYVPDRDGQDGVLAYILSGAASIAAAVGEAGPSSAHGMIANRREDPFWAARLTVDGRASRGSAFGFVPEGSRRHGPDDHRHDLASVSSSIAAQTGTGDDEGPPLATLRQRLGLLSTLQHQSPRASASGIFLRLSANNNLRLEVGRPAGEGSARGVSPLSQPRCRATLVAPDSRQARSSGGASEGGAAENACSDVQRNFPRAPAVLASAASGLMVAMPSGTTSGVLERVAASLPSLRPFVTRRRRRRSSLGPIQVFDTRSEAEVQQAGAGNAAMSDGTEADSELAPALPTGTSQEAPSLLEMPISVSALPPRPLLEEVERLLADCEGWQYDTWALQSASGGHALSCMAFYLLFRTGLQDRFRLQPHRLARLLVTLEAGYHANNPYHNATHAADVLRSLHVLLHGARLTVNYLDHMGLLAAYFAAIIHDYDHPGLTNDFLVASSHPLALCYNDRAPLESHHAGAFFTLLAERPELDPLEALQPEERVAFRRQVIDMVLATDMKQHFSILSHFSTLHNVSAKADGTQEPNGSDVQSAAAAAKQATPPISQAVRSGRAYDSEGASSHGAANRSTEVPAIAAPVPLDETERLLSIQMALKVADVGHLGAQLQTHKRWLSGLEEEFFRQGDQERAVGLPTSPLFDRTKQGVSKSQVGFYDFVALPLVRALASAFPGACPLLQCFQDNYQHWRQVEAAALQTPSPMEVANATESSDQL